MRTKKVTPEEKVKALIQRGDLRSLRRAGRILLERRKNGTTQWAERTIELLRLKIDEIEKERRHRDV